MIPLTRAQSSDSQIHDDDNNPQRTGRSRHLLKSGPTAPTWDRSDAAMTVTVPSTRSGSSRAGCRVASTGRDKKGLHKGENHIHINLTANPGVFKLFKARNTFQ